MNKNKIVFTAATQLKMVMKMSIAIGAVKIQFIHIVFGSNCIMVKYDIEHFAVMTVNMKQLNMKERWKEFHKILRTEHL